MKTNLNINDIILKSIDPNFNPRTMYNQNFQDGKSKSEKVLNWLSSNSVKLSKLAYVSIGGADGMEVITSLKNSEINKGLLIEFDSSFCNCAKKNMLSLQKEKELKIIEGDVWNTASKAKNKIQKWQDAGEINGVIISIHSVLHELPWRSIGFRNSLRQGQDAVDKLIRSIIGKSENVFIYCREPCSIDEWKGRVRLSTPDFLSPPDLHKLAQFIKERFRDIHHSHNFDSEIFEDGESIILDSSLAAEIVKKLVYFHKDNNDNNLIYELSECHSALDANSLVRSFTKLVNKGEKYQYNCQHTRISSDTFRKHYLTSNITVVPLDIDMFASSIPNIFVEIFANYNLIKNAS